MSLLIDSSLWVDYFRRKTPARIKERIVPYIDSAEAALCDPIRFEILRASLPHERESIEAVFSTLPLLATPADFWARSAALGQKCAEAGSMPPALDLLIAVIALEHDAKVITFDAHFEEIARISALSVLLLDRPAKL